VAVRELLQRLTPSTRKGTRRALAEKAEGEGWDAVEQVRVDGQAVDLVLSKSVVVLVRLSPVPVTEQSRDEFEAAAERLGCVGLILDTDGPELCRARPGRVMVVGPKVVERLVAGEMTMGEVLAAFGLGL
jgi:hypothetical protein